MAYTCAVVFFASVLTYAAYCTSDEQSLDQMLGENIRKLMNSEELSIRILVTGKVGVGKSTLVNALVGMNVSKTGDDVASVTKKVERKVVNKNGIRVYITDTPGLGDLDIEDDDTLCKAREYNEDIDLFIFCLKMTEGLERYHIEEMKAITKIFGKSIWKKGLFVLTFANEEKHFRSKLHQWENELAKRIQAIGVAEKVPIVPTGFKEPQLPDRPSWVSELWIQGFRRMGFKMMVYLAILNIERIHDTTEELKLSQDMYGNPEDQPLVTCYMSKEERWINPKHIRRIGQFVGGLLFTAVSWLQSGVNIGMVPALREGVSTGNWTANVLLDYFDWSVKEEVHCHDEVIIRSLIATFLEENPEYKMY